MANPKAAKHRTAIEKNPAHYIDLRVKPVDDLSDPETTPFRVYYETAAGDRHFTVIETITDLTATRIVSHTVPNCTVIVTAFPGEYVETVGYTEVKSEMLDALALHQPKPTADSLAEFAKLAESGTITRSQFETFAYHAVNSPLPLIRLMLSRMILIPTWSTVPPAFSSLNVPARKNGPFIM